MEWVEDARRFADAYHTEILYFFYGILALGLLQNLIYFVQIPLAAAALRRMRAQRLSGDDRRLLGSDEALPISVIIPAYNEELTICHTVTATLATHYPSFDVVVVNDGSKDGTLAALIEKFKLKKTPRFYENALPHKPIRDVYSSSSYPNVIVVDKENGGKADAVNAGIDVSRRPIFCTLDADSLLDPVALLKTVRPFMDDPERIVASGGTVRLLNGCETQHGVISRVALPRRLLPLLQIVEYVRAFLMGRLAWSRLGLLTLISGAFAVFRRDVAIEVGGFSVDTIGEDFELVMKLHKHFLSKNIPYDMRFVPEPVCWTEAPESFRVLGSQRKRWQQGALEVQWRHRDMFLNAKYGRIGCVAYPLMFIVDALGPLAELLGYVSVPVFYAIGALSRDFMIAYICLFFMFGIFISVMSLVLEEISLKRFAHAKSLALLGAVAVVENFGYRQYTNLWRIAGWYRFLRKKQVWGKMTRVAGHVRTRP
ncbi:MAG: glycosyltransferase [Rickettsiales bacterium]